MSDNDASYARKNKRTIIDTDSEEEKEPQQKQKPQPREEISKSASQSSVLPQPPSIKQHDRPHNGASSGSRQMIPKSISPKPAQKKPSLPSKMPTEMSSKLPMEVSSKTLSDLTTLPSKPIPKKTEIKKIPPTTKPLPTNKPPMTTNKSPITANKVQQHSKPINKPVSKPGTKRKAESSSSISSASDASSSDNSSSSSGTDSSSDSSSSDESPREKNKAELKGAIVKRKKLDNGKEVSVVKKTITVKNESSKKNVSLKDTPRKDIDTPKKKKNKAPDSIEAVNLKKKDHVVIELLKRWWFVLPDWPPVDYDYTSVLNKNGLRNVNIALWKLEPDVDEEGLAKCFELEWFKGVFKDNEGKMHDFRPRENCPSFNEFSKKDNRELLTLLKTAIDEQMRVLENTDPYDLVYQKKLIRDLKMLRTKTTALL